MAIIHSLEVLARKHPDMRFHQLLWAAGLIEKRSDEIVDKFYEESRDTWEQMNFAFRQTIIVKSY
jgi:hypothetical protein